MLKQQERRRKPPEVRLEPGPWFHMVPQVDWLITSTDRLLLLTEHRHGHRGHQQQAVGLGVEELGDTTKVILSDQTNQRYLEIISIILHHFQKTKKFLVTLI